MPLTYSTGRSVDKIIICLLPDLKKYRNYIYPLCWGFIVDRRMGEKSRSRKVFGILIFTGKRTFNENLKKCKDLVVEKCRNIWYFKKVCIYNCAVQTRNGRNVI